MDSRIERRNPITGPTYTFSRRTLLAAVPGLMLLAAGVACGGDDDDDPAPTATTSSGAGESTPTIAGTAASNASPEATPASSGSADGEWSFTDDRGVTITLPKRPERVVPYVPIAASLWDFGVRPVGVFGTSVRPDGTPEITAGALDFETVASLGEVYGEMDLEALVALQPDLILFDMYGPVVDVWGLTPEAIAQVEAIAPIAGISFVERPVDETIGKIEELAELLGADLSLPDVVAARERFDAASEAVRAACAAQDGLTTMFVGGWTDNFFVANSPVWTDLIYFKDLGLDVVEPDVAAGELWETLSWEQANKYPVDLILNDARAAALSPEQLAEYPTWVAQPAVEAGQVGEWYTEFVPSYAGFATILEALAETVAGARADVA